MSRQQEGFYRDNMYLGLDVDSKRGNVRLEPDVCVSQRASEVQKPFRSGSHTGQKRKMSRQRKEMSNFFFLRDAYMVKVEEWGV
jgi:hypothetical protein